MSGFKLMAAKLAFQFPLSSLACACCHPSLYAHACSVCVCVFLCNNLNNMTDISPKIWETSVHLPRTN